MGQKLIDKSQEFVHLVCPMNSFVFYEIKNVFVMFLIPFWRKVMNTKTILSYFYQFNV